MRRQIGTLAFAVVFAACACGDETSPKKRVAVYGFDVPAAAPRTGKASSSDLGNLISDLLVTHLVQQSVFSVVERTAIDKILKEQNVSNSDRFDSGTASQIGHLLGVHFLILGGVSRYTHERDSGSVKGTVRLTARMVSTDTAEVVKAVQSVGESTSAARAQSSGDDGVTESVMSDALSKAVARLAFQINRAFAPSLPVPVSHSDPQDSDFDRGLLQLKNRRYQLAARSFESVTARHPDHVEAWYNLGVAYMNSNRCKLAVQKFTRAIQIAQPVSAFYDRGVCFMSAGMENYRLAVSDFSRVLERDPQNTNAIYNRAVCHMNLDERGAALADFSSFISLSSDSGQVGRAYHNRAQILRKLGKLDEAAAEEERAGGK